MRKQDQIILEKADYHQLELIVNKGEHKAREIKHSQSLLKSGAGWTDSAVAQAFEVSTRTFKRVRPRFVEGGLELAVSDRRRSGRPIQYDGPDQALVLATACTPPPEGARCWTIALLTEPVIALGLADISRETVRRTLKKRIATAQKAAVVSWRNKSVVYCTNGGGAGMVRERLRRVATSRLFGRERQGTVQNAAWGVGDGERSAKPG